MGVDVMHFNVHKTFSTPHGGGGPGAGPVAVRAILESFLPVPHVRQTENGGFAWDWERPDAIGSLHGFRGNAGVILRALTYIMRHGGEGLQRVSSDAVLSANYILARLKDAYETANPNGCKHECVLSAAKLRRSTVFRRGISPAAARLRFHAHGVFSHHRQRIDDD